MEVYYSLGLEERLKNWSIYTIHTDSEQSYSTSPTPDYGCSQTPTRYSVSTKMAQTSGL